MKVVTKSKLFGELKKLCKPEMGLVPKSSVVKAFENAQFDVNIINNEIFDIIMDTFFEDINKTIILKTDNLCDCCPLREVCEKLKLFYGCGVWEDSMEDDL